MNYNRFTLSFIREDSNLEKEFQYAYFQYSLKIVKATFLMAAIFYGLFGILDAVLFPHTKKIAWIIRYAIVCPFTLSLFAFSYSRQFYKYWQVSQVFLIAMAGTGIIGIIVTAPGPANILYYAGLILVLMYGYTALIMRFIWASAKIKTLSGLLPICSKCKKIRDDKGYWKQIEHFISIHSDAEFSHSICPQCAEELYGDLLSYKKKPS